jgi:SOS-response transcriptional repressor LexA
MRHTLTLKQADAYEFVRRHIKEKSVAPSFAEIMDALGLKSKNHVSSLLNSLEERGYIHRIKGRQRAIALIPDTHAEILVLRRIRDAANAYVSTQGKYRTAYDDSPDSSETQQLGPKVSQALENLKQLVLGEMTP